MISAARELYGITLKGGIFHRRPPDSSAHCRFHDTANVRRYFTAYDAARSAVTYGLFLGANGDAEHYLSDAPHLAARQ